MASSIPFYHKDLLSAIFLAILFINHIVLNNCNIIIEETTQTVDNVERVIESLPMKTDEPIVDTAVRCSCNLPKCVRFGYMCKSEEGICFIYYNETTPDLERYSYMHHDFPLQGCIEDLPKETKKLCKQKVAQNKFNSYDIKQDGLTCCKSHVCNYQKAPMKQYKDYVQRRVEPTDSIRLSTEFFAGACVVAIPIIGGVMFMIFLCFGRKMLLQERTYSPVQKNENSNVCHHMTNFQTCIPTSSEKCIPFVKASNSQKLVYVVCQNSACSLSTASFLSISLPDLSMKNLRS